MAFEFFTNLKEADKSKAVKQLIDSSSPDQMFFLMIVLSVMMATFGVLEDNAPVIIGSMLIAPMLYPVLSLSMGFVMSDASVISRSSRTIFQSFLFALVASVVVAVFFSAGEPVAEQVTYFARPTIISAAVAVIAGLAGSFALVKEELNEALPGVAISVSLVPPLAVVGVGIAKLDGVVASSAALLFAINVLGIVFASMIVFSTMNFYSKRDVAQKELKKDNEKIEEDKIVEKTDE